MDIQEKNYYSPNEVEENKLPIDTKSVWHTPELHKNPLSGNTNNFTFSGSDGMVATIPS